MFVGLSMNSIELYGVVLQGLLFGLLLVIAALFTKGGRQGLIYEPLASFKKWISSILKRKSQSKERKNNSNAIISFIKKRPKNVLMSLLLIHFLKALVHYIFDPIIIIAKRRRTLDE